jgi:hypothetical protein
MLQLTSLLMMLFDLTSGLITHLLELHEKFAPNESDLKEDRF